MPKAVRVEETGGPDVLRALEMETPAPGPGELLVDVAAAGVNFLDTYLRGGVYPRDLPFGIGVEGAGHVVALGDGVSGFAAGDRVAWANAQGSYAETAAAAPLQGLTAHYLVNSTYPVARGDTVLVHAAAGGVGLLLTQLAAAKGARVLATASTEEKRELARQAGADEVFGYQDFPARVRELTGGEGVAAVYDGVGAATFDGGLASLRGRGTMVLFGGSSGQVPPFDPQRLNSAGSLFLTRPSLPHYVATRDELTWRASELFGAVTAGTVTVRIGGRYPLADASAAHRDLEGRRTTGKLLLIP